MTRIVSTKASKQRRAIYKAPLSRRRRLMSASLSTELKTSQGRNSYPVRKGDTVKILRGDFAGIEGKITNVDTRRHRLFIEGVSREKVAGTSTTVSVDTSKVMITKLDLDDKWRAESIKVAVTKNSQQEA
ncbi:MAG TPA: 50S ribosomal protein L24 [Methylomirabilota bacterium]|nr:50S ribosomal protein L24 [Methylomirabilota bacterium]